MLETDVVLHIDLSGSRVEICSVSDDMTDRFLGGRGLAAALSCRWIPDGCDPLGPENTLAIATGMLTGTSAPASARTHFSALSPLTGMLGSSNAGGHFGPDLRSCGIRGLVITGRSPQPVYLLIDRGDVRVHAAGHLWGSDTRQCARLLRSALGGDALRVLCIGPAGEHHSAMACIMLDTHDAAGRTGLGAVMGSKHLKAIVVRGRRREALPGPARQRAAADYARALTQSEMCQTIGTYGQSGYIRWSSEMGMLSTRNYQSGTFDHAGSICGTKMRERVIRRRSCHRCPIHCKADVVVAAGTRAGETGTRPEFESIAALGAKCGQSDMDAVLHLTNLCNRLGLDTISAGSAVAFAMELYEKRILTDTDTQGMALSWGDAHVQEQLLEQMAHRRGFGAVLTDGVRAAAERIGRGSRQLAFHSKGLELCGYDPRGSMSTALGYAVSGRGGDYASVFANAEFRWNADTALARVGHLEGADRFSTVAKAEMVRRCGICSAVVDALGLCKVAAMGILATFDLVAEAALVQAMFGGETTAGDLLVVGERILNLERLFNLRHSRQHGGKDRLPDRFLTESLPAGPARHSRVDLETMLAEYYRLMGWDARGVPRVETIRGLDLADFQEVPPAVLTPCRFN